MAKGRSSSRRSKPDVTRDTSRIANDWSLSSLLLRPEPMTDVEDRRLWSPDVEPSGVTIGGRVARVIVHRRPVVARANTILTPRGLPVGLQVPIGLRYESPLFVLTCLRRKIRREIMFAKRKVGFGKKVKPPRRGWRSNISC